MDSKEGKVEPKTSDDKHEDMEASSDIEGGNEEIAKAASTSQESGATKTAAKKPEPPVKVRKKKARDMPKRPLR